MYSLILPLSLIVGGLYFVALDKLLFLIVFLTPFSVNLEDLSLGVGVTLPTEPLLFGLLIIFILKSLLERNYDKDIINHPISVAIIINLLWIFLSAIKSEIPLVSFKFLLSRLWFIVPMFFMTIVLFKKQKNIKYFPLLYSISLVIVIIYTTINHAKSGFGLQESNWVMAPFYNDHTAYGAAIAFFIPPFVGFIFEKSYTKQLRITSGIILSILLIGLILSNSRAAWISTAAALGIYVVVISRIKFRYILSIVVIFVGLFYTFQFEIIDYLERNKQDSSKNFVEHIQSMSNISSDASNLERLNRWACAFRMFEERPFWGYGPGTYQFVYAPFQKSVERTIISTNAGDLGNAHSEFIGPLAESGIFGMLTTFIMVFVFVYYAIRVYRRAENSETKMLAMSSLVSVGSYFVHGILNNFLNSDKLSVPVWSFMAIVVALDLYQIKKQNSDTPIG